MFLNAGRNGRSGSGAAAGVRLLLIVLVPLLAIRRQWQRQQQNISFSSTTSDEKDGIVASAISNVRGLFLHVKLIFSQMTYRELLPPLLLFGVLGILALLVILGHVFKSRIDQHEMRIFLVEDKETTFGDIVDEMDLYLNASGSSMEESEQSGQDVVGSQKLFGDNKVTVCVQCLAALAKRYNALRLLKSKLKSKKGRKRQDRMCSENLANATINGDEAERLCCDASMIVLRHFPDQDEAVAAALSLLALVAKTKAVRSQLFRSMSAVNDKKTLASHKKDDNYLSKKPILLCIKAMEDSLERTKEATTVNASNAANQGGISVTKRNENTGTEQLAAELQRKGCLMLGALADDHAETATKVVSEGGLNAILAAVDWFRLHQDVCSWGLWAIFVLCYSHDQNKNFLIREGGLDQVCRIMIDIPESMEVQRHGVAILYDVLRETSAQSPNIQGVAKLRTVALNAGLQKALISAMIAHPKNIEIHMMSRQMLFATGYLGDIPEFKGQMPQKKSDLP